MLDITYKPHRTTKTSTPSLVLYFTLVAACSTNQQDGNPVAADASPVSYSVEVMAEYPHDPEAFTQGLLVEDGFFYESTGLYGQSSLRKVELSTGDVAKTYSLESNYFAEGLVKWNDTLIQLTWKSGVAFVYEETDSGFDRSDKVFQYDHEGWGITTDGKQWILSDGTSTLRFLELSDFSLISSVEVTLEGQALDQLNELEYIDGAVYANVWLTNQIVIIDPSSGIVTGLVTVDLESLLGSEVVSALGSDDVLNGIAYDSDQDRILITGKRWPKIFEVQFVANDGLSLSSSL
ncbi:glutaminyl-peptide cyclotransferase [Pseudobacteriovorax antillogorgiicola]|uniref:Glutamine cyclotransferase n=1 Tax=Pseudobacteriovorax antillogorgiicola TaxID=1513793 RepID=A0A1Y6BT78_9BACT|nr:glutaminyl-peptide cyclotransferase [Pseudobacteriovorax antillogorgiicola]TCS54508.1 glutamine cyclotransferase [Pseudobacteriovorax antillogorgiicola]SMF18968.1 Glutamine cyclotransferase [Pseudobacteriovorax antillogorgiicola]